MCIRDSVKSVTDELGGSEKIDIIQFSVDDAQFIREALSPAEIIDIELDKKEHRAVVKVAVDQAPLAIGRGGMNVNLASRLTGYELDIVQIGGTPVEEVAEEPITEETPAEA